MATYGAIKEWVQNQWDVDIVYFNRSQHLPTDTIWLSVSKECRQRHKEGHALRNLPPLGKSSSSLGKGWLEVPGDQWHVMTSCKSHMSCTVGSRSRVLVWAVRKKNVYSSIQFSQSSFVNSMRVASSKTMKNKCLLSIEANIEIDEEVKQFYN